jgi:hypothetical protein
MFRIVVAILIVVTTSLIHAAEIPDAQYVRVSPDGHLEVDGGRVRFWGFIGGSVGGLPQVNEETPDVRAERLQDHYRGLDMWADRIADLGFNMYRTWESGHAMATDHDYTPGDGSAADTIAYFYHRLGRRGVKLWMSSTNSLGHYSADDVDVIDDPATADAWRTAVQELMAANKGNPITLRSNSSSVSGLLRMTDPRVEALFLRRMRQMADFPNKYKDGLRLGDDPQVAVWEMVNEEFPFRLWFGGHWQALPEFFRRQITDKWHAYLKEKYGNEAKLIEAWGFLLPGESLDGGTINIAPLGSGALKVGLNDPNAQRWQSVQVAAGRLPREKFNWYRGADVTEFFVKLTIDHKLRLRDAIRGMGKSCRLSPIIFDSGNDFSIHAAYMHQHADAVSTCSYNKQMGFDPTDRRFPFWSLLDESPRAGWDVPWFEQSKAKGKPHFVYETNTDQRSKYRAEYPMFIAALASINDWDIICWHSASGRPKDLAKLENPWAGANAIWHDYLMFRDDEVQNAAMRAAGEIFKNQLLKPAPQPTTFVFGRKSLFEPEAMDYGRSYGQYGDRFIPTAYRHGAQVEIDPGRESDEIIGPSRRPNVFEANPVQPHEQISFDRSKGHLIFDSPAVAGYAGFFAQYGKDKLDFSNGVSLSDIAIHNPDGIAYPVTEDEKYFVFSLNSTDGRPLAEAKRAMMIATSTSFNTGFQLDTTRSAPGNHREGARNEPPREYFGAWPSNAGKTPVLVARVSATVTAPALDGMRYTLRDWHLREIGSGIVTGGTVQIPADRPVFMIELQRD